MPTYRSQPSFAAGVLGPGLHGRSDIAKYDVGLKVGENVFIHAHGGVSNRPGTEFICEVMDHTKEHRLLPFQRGADDNYIMLMGNLSMKLIFEGGVVQSGGSDYNPVTPYTNTQILAADYVQSIDVMYFAHPDVAPQKMERTAATTWTFAALTVDPQITAPTGVTITPANAGTEAYTYKVSPIENGVEGFPSSAGTNALCADLTGSGEENVITWTGTADEFNVYRGRNNVFGYIGFTDANTFTDDNISNDLTVTPREAAGVFGSASNYPSAVSLWQQRLAFANSLNQPETIWMSRSGDYENFTKSRILSPSDRAQFDLAGSRINRISYMIPLRELLAFTEGGEFSVTGPNGAMDATNPIITQYGYSGIGSVKPLVVEDTALFVDGTERQVRDLRYAFEQDGYAGNDLSIFAYHYFEGRTVKDWCYAKSPFSIVWVCLDDGTLLSLTYKREHQVWAWARHDVGGDVESLASIPEAGEDAVYMIVKRTINSSTVRYVERVHSRRFDVPEDCFFVDCGLTYDGAAATSITGLDHLEGEAVVALADGDVVDGLTVSSGAVTLPSAASKVHIGLSFTAEIETLPPTIDLRDIGTARGQKHKISKTKLQLEKTRGIKIGSVGTRLEELVQTGGDLAETISLKTGMVEMYPDPTWTEDGTLRVVQSYPLPMTILAVLPGYSIGRS